MLVVEVGRYEQGREQRSFITFCKFSVTGVLTVLRVDTHDVAKLTRCERKQEYIIFLSQGLNQLEPLGQRG